MVVDAVRFNELTGGKPICRAAADDVVCALVLCCVVGLVGTCLDGAGCKEAG